MNAAYYYVLMRGRSAFASIIRFHTSSAFYICGKFSYLFLTGFVKRFEIGHEPCSDQFA